jgi:hypothetical protein
VISATQTLALAILAGEIYNSSPAGLAIDAVEIRAVLTELDGCLVVAIRGAVPTN